MKNLRTLLAVLSMLFLPLGTMEAINYPTYKPSTRSNVATVETTPVRTSFRSTSTMLRGSSLSTASQSGPVTTYEQGDPYSNISYSASPRRAWGGDEEDEEGGDGNLSGDEDGDQNPGSPIGSV